MIGHPMGHPNGLTIPLLGGFIKGWNSLNSFFDMDAVNLVSVLL